MHLSRHFQNAYVTHDMEAAKAHVTRQYGVKDYIAFEVDSIVTTPTGGKPQQVRVVLAWIGNFQIEIIQPIGGFIDPFRDFLPKDENDPSLRFHHICMRRDDLDAMQKEIDEMGLPRVFENDFSVGFFVYLDARATLGHYLEYTWATPEGWDMMGWPKGLA